MSSAIPDFGFRSVPRPNQWLARCLPAKAGNLFHHWNRRLRACLSLANVRPCAWYGGIKSPAGLWRRIRHWNRGEDLDLWDSVRFRVVVDSIHRIADLFRLLVDEFGKQIVRCRNYYLHPRKGPMDPYRAIHLEVHSDDEDFAEVQLVSARREAVGLIDHSFVLKRRVPFMSAAHAAWLWRISWAANVLDLRDAGGASLDRLHQSDWEDGPVSAARGPPSGGRVQPARQTTHSQPPVTTIFT